MRPQTGCQISLAPACASCDTQVCTIRLVPSVHGRFAHPENIVTVGLAQPLPLRDMDYILTMHRALHTQS